MNAYREEVGAKCKRLRRDLLLCCHPDHHHRYETAEEACTATTQAIERVPSVHHLEGCHFCYAMDASEAL